MNILIKLYIVTNGKILKLPLHSLYITYFLFQFDPVSLLHMGSRCYTSTKYTYLVIFWDVTVCNY